MTDWPILSPHSLDYVKGSYETENTFESNSSTRVRHTLVGDNLVRRLVIRGRAQFAVEVAAPHSAYRAIEIAKEQSASHATQLVEWANTNCCDPVSIRPLVVFDRGSHHRITLDSVEDGVHSVWHRKEIVIQPGAILAREHFFRPASGLSILRLAVDDQAKIPEGAFTVETTEVDGFVFKVRMHKKLFEDLQTPGTSIDHRDSILTGALVSGLAMIRRDYTNNDRDGGEWTQYPNLRILEKLLRENGVSTWEDDQFDPAFAATVLKPIVFSPDQSNE